MFLLTSGGCLSTTLRSNTDQPDHLGEIGRGLQEGGGRLPQQ